MNKKVLPAIYSAAVWCLFVVLLLLAPPRQGSNMTLALCEGSRVQVGNERIIITGVCFSEMMNGVYYSMHNTKL